LSGTAINGTLSTAAQPNITSVGTITNLTVSGRTTAANLSVTSNATVTGTLIAGTLSATTYIGNISAAQNIQIYTSGTGSYIVPAGVYSILVEISGGGGGGGGIASSGTSGIQASSGGGAGGYARSIIAVTPGQSISYTVGGAGTGASGANGNAGGNSSFGTLTANGGAGGLLQANGTTVLRTAGGAGGAAAGGDVNITGSEGSPGIRFSGTIGFSGEGGDSQLGKGGKSVIISNSSIAGVAASGYGAGGSGAFFLRTSGTPAAQTGGSGTAGVVIIHEFK